MVGIQGACLTINLILESISTTYKFSEGLPKLSVSPSKVLEMGILWVTKFCNKSFDFQLPTIKSETKNNKCQ